LTSKHIKLRPVTDLELIDLANASAGCLLNDEQKQWLEEWATEESPEYQLSMLQHSWLWKAEWDINDWLMEFGVFCENKLVGLVSIGAVNFPENKRLITGLWLLPEARGKGLGLLTKQILLHFGFQYLQASSFVAEIHKSNSKSLKINQDLNYSETDPWQDCQSKEDRIYLELFKSNWKKDVEVTVIGFDQSKRFFFSDNQESEDRIL
jgi:RimJ/RimL family protein N-acetyltransferase